MEWYEFLEDAFDNECGHCGMPHTGTGAYCNDACKTYDNE